MLLKQDCDLVNAGDVDTALRVIDEKPPDLILLDLLMPGRNGIELLGELRDRGLKTPVIVLTATKTVATAVEAMKRGAADFVTKPFELEALRMKVRQLLAHSALEQEVAQLRDEVSGRQQLRGLLGKSPAMREVFRAIERVAPSRANVLISGESGTGKELAARAIHELSPRHEGPYVAVNCGAIPQSLIESELFGHERGAFTDAVDQRIGRFESASGGTLLLDEIGEVEPAVQVKLLRVCQVLQHRGEVDDLRKASETAIGISREQGFSVWITSPKIFSGWARSQQGNAIQGAQEAEEGLHAIVDAGIEIRRPYYLALVAECYILADRLAEARTILDQALAIVAETDEHWSESELLRLTGEIEARADSAAAEAIFQQALTIARCQDAKSWELRSATSLAQLWHGQGNSDDARSLLQPIFDWFTEGFDTPDLQVAKALLDELS